MRNIEVECNITIFSPYPQCGKSFLLPGLAPCLRLRFIRFSGPGLWYLCYATDVSCSPGFVCLFLVTFTVLALVTFTFTFVRSGMFMVMVLWFWLRYIRLPLHPAPLPLVLVWHTFRLRSRSPGYGYVLTSMYSIIRSHGCSHVLHYLHPCHTSLRT